MSIGLVIANISGSVRQSPAVTAEAATVDDAAHAATAPTTSSGAAAFSDPLSGQAQLTPGLTLVVLELLNDKGAVVSTIPSARQLAAYRNGTATPPS